MKENKLIKILIPIVALIVVFESIVLVSSLSKSNSKVVINEENQDIVDSSSEGERGEEVVADFIWETDSLAMKVGKTYSVTLNLLSKKDLILDSIETYVYFDPKLVSVTNLVTNGDEVGEELKSGIDNKNGIISSILWSGEKTGVGFETKTGESVEVLTFKVTPKSEGKINFNLSTSKEDNKFASIIVETNTVKSLTYLSSNLEINVTK